MFDFDDLPDDMPGETTSLSKHATTCVYAVSDVHTDMKDNLDLMEGWLCRPRDVLILAGDVSNNLKILRATLEVACARFGRVFFCPGNHDLWLHKEDGCSDSVQKLHKILELCEEVGVRTQPEEVDGILIVPLHSWYHASFDEDPDVTDDDLAPVEKVMMDFHLCKWPGNLTTLDGSDTIARYMDDLNKAALSSLKLDDQDRCGYKAIISFSHFLPRPDLMPEKRSLFYPPLPKAVGSLFLGKRVQQLAPNVHIFGHTHYGWDAKLEGIRYLQACLAYPRERMERLFAVNCNDAAGVEAAPPLMVYSGRDNTFPSYRGFWSEYYRLHPRKPLDVRWIYRGKRKKEQVVAALQKVVEGGICEVDDVSIRAHMAM